jgi:hypothetical protein
VRPRLQRQRFVGAVVVVPDVELPVVPVVLELELVEPVVSVVDEPLAPMPLELVLLPGVVTVVLVLALGVTVVVLSRPDVRVVVVDVQPAARAAAIAMARIERERCVIGLPCSRTLRNP